MCVSLPLAAISSLSCPAPGAGPVAIVHLPSRLNRPANTTIGCLQQPADPAVQRLTAKWTRYLPVQQIVIDCAGLK